MKIRSLVKEKLLKQNCLCMTLIFKCIFRYIPNLGRFLVHKLQKYKNIHKDRDNYFSKCLNTTEILPPFRSHQNNYSQRNKQKLFTQLQMNTLQNLSLKQPFLSMKKLIFQPHWTSNNLRSKKHAISPCYAHLLQEGLHSFTAFKHVFYIYSQ